eukprot:1157207-Pelagomonas_calceolata.AAC.2
MHTKTTPHIYINSGDQTKGGEALEVRAQAYAVAAVAGGTHMMQHVRGKHRAHDGMMQHVRGKHRAHDGMLQRVRGKRWAHDGMFQRVCGKHRAHSTLYLVRRGELAATSMKMPCRKRRQCCNLNEAATLLKASTRVLREVRRACCYLNLATRGSSGKVCSVRTGKGL